MNFWEPNSVLYDVAYSYIKNIFKKNHDKILLHRVNLRTTIYFVIPYITTQCKDPQKFIKILLGLLQFCTLLYFRQMRSFIPVDP